MTHRRGILYVTGALLVSCPPVVWVASMLPGGPHGTVIAPVALGDEAQKPPENVRKAELVELAKRDPMALVKRGRAWYEDHIRGYRCTLIKQELLGDKLSEVQEIELRFRAQPLAIYMLWKTNPDQARRALYMDTPKYVDKKGHKLTRVEPNGAVARLFTKDIFLPIDSPECKKSSRRCITDAGFHTTFELFEAYNAVAAEKGVLDLKYTGTGTVDGRPTFVLTRLLPYDGPSGPYPDAKLVMHLDQEWLLPVAIYSYADQDEKELLGSYVFTQVQLNPDFGADEFAF